MRSGRESLFISEVVESVFHIFFFRALHANVAAPLKIKVVRRGISVGETSIPRIIYSTFPDSQLFYLILYLVRLQQFVHESR